MSELMEKETQETQSVGPVLHAEPPDGEKTAGKEKRRMSKKKRRRMIRWACVLLVLAAAGAAAYRFWGGSGGEGESEVVVDTVQYGSITSVVESNGLTKAKNSETISITTAGTVMDVFVTEGQVVAAGDPLFVIDSPAARNAVETARSNVEGYQKQLSTAQKDIAGLNLTPGYPGKLMETVTLNPGDSISKGQKLAVLADDTRLRLTQYYSYAYADSLKAGQSIDVSIPALMTSVTGYVETVHMVSRITPEGSKLFAAEIVLENEGVLAAEMVASAT